MINKPDFTFTMETPSVLNHFLDSHSTGMKHQLLFTLQAQAENAGDRSAATATQAADLASMT